MTRLFGPISWPPDVPEDAIWFLRCMILYGASSVRVDLDGKHIKGIRFAFRSGPERHVLYDRPALPLLIVGRGPA